MLICMPASAQALFNFGEATFSSSSWGNNYAAEFTVGGSGTWNLNNVVVNVGNGGGPAVIGMDLFQDNGGGMIGPSFVGTLSLSTFFLTAPNQFITMGGNGLTLNSGATYFLVPTANIPTITWYYANSPTASFASSGWSFGPSWQDLSPWTQNTSDTFKVFIDASQVSAVPEPSTYALLALGTVALGFMHRRRAKA